MAVSIWPYLALLYGIFFARALGKEVSLDQFLNDYLGTVDVPFSLSVPLGGGVTMDLSGECNQVALDSIDTHDEEFQLGLNVSGLGLSCDIEAQALGFTFDIDFHLENTSWVNVPIEVPPYVPDENDRTLLLPQKVAVNMNNCTGELHGSHKVHLPLLLRRYKSQIDALLTDPKTICAAVGGILALGNGTIQKLDDGLLENVHELREDRGLNESIFDDPNGDIAKIADNVGTRYIKRLLDTLGNPASSESINKVLKENGGDSLSYGVDNDPLANVACPHNPDKTCPIFPLSLEFPVSNYTVGLNITGLSVSGLDTFSKIALHTPSVNMVDLALGLEDLAVKVNVSMRMMEAGGADELLEHFSVDLGLKNFSLGITGFWHFNGTTADKFAFLQLPHLGCLSQAVNSTQAGLTHANLSLPSLEFSLTPAGQPDHLERGLDDTVYALSQLILQKYSHAVAAEANWVLSIYARNMLNSKLTEYLALPVTDVDEPKPHNDTRVCLPAAPTYQSQFLHNAGLYGAIAATVVAALALVTVPFAKKRHLNKVKQTPPPRDVPDAVAPLTAGAYDAPLDNNADNNADGQSDENVSLARNQKLPLGLRAGLPILVFGNFILFISSNAGSGASIFVDISAGGQPLFPVLPPAFDFSLVNTIVEMAQGQVWLLVFVIGFFSGIWPYAKLSMMLVCWFMPATMLSVNTRHKLLEFLDAFGKWSLVDTYVLVLFVVAFSINMECGTAPSPVFQQVCDSAGVGDFLFKLYVLPTIGFHTFLISTLMSLVNGLAMSTCHRYVHRIGEFGPAEEYERIEGLGNKRRLCSVLKDNGKFASVGVTLGLMLSMVLAVVGVFMTTFEFVFQGVAGLALGDSKYRAYSLFGLGEALPAASINPNTFGIHWIQFFFIAFSGVTVLIFLGLLLVLWNLPLTVKGQRTFLVLAQVMNAWSGLDVFVVAILACVLEISQFANFIIGDTGLDVVNPYLPSIFAFFPNWNQQLQESGGATVFTLTTHLEPGFWLLAVAAILSTGIGQMTLNKCSKALFDTKHQPLANSIAASFTTTAASTITGP